MTHWRDHVPGLSSEGVKESVAQVIKMGRSERTFGVVSKGVPYWSWYAGGMGTCRWIHGDEDAVVQGDSRPRYIDVQDKQLVDLCWKVFYLEVLVNCELSNFTKLSNHGTAILLKRSFSFMHLARPNGPYQQDSIDNCISVYLIDLPLHDILV